MFLCFFQFFGCLFLIFAAEAVAGILGFLYRDRVGLTFYSFSLVISHISVFLSFGYLNSYY